METPVILLFPRAWDLGFFFFLTPLTPPNPFSYKRGWETSPSETGVSRCLRPKFHSNSSPFSSAVLWPGNYQPRA